MGKFKVVECGLLVFLAALIPRIVLNLFFYASYGLYAVNHVEAWLFKAVMSGTHLNFLTHSGGDPTVWILTGLSPYVPPEYHIIAVEWVGVLLSCATAVSIYFLANALYGRKTGLAAGIIYAMMVEPLALSTAGFTHDMLSIPLVVISLTLMVYAIRGGLIYGLVCSAMYYIVWAVAKNVNDSINVAVFASAIYAGFHFYMWGFEKFGVEDRIFSFSGKTPKYITKLRKAYNGYLPRVCQSHFSTFLGLLADSVSDVRKHVGKLKYLTYVGVVVFLLFLFNARILSGILDETLSALPQGRMGSADVTPATAGTYWLRYNILLLVFPLIAYYSLKREDIIGITVACLGFLFSMQMDRGTRIVDVGVAIMAALTLTFESKKNKPNTIRWVMGTWFAAVVVYMFFFTSSKFILTASALIFGIALYFGVMSGKTRYCLVVIAVYGLLLNLYYLYDLEARKIVTEGEYHVLKWLSGNNRGGSVLAAWDKGYLIEAVSGLGAVSTPNDIQKEIHSMLWMPDRQASINLRNNGVRYVLLNTENFNIVRFDDEYIYRLGGGLIFHDEYVPRVELADRYTIYKLVYGKSSYFKLLKNETDKNTG
ncbi:MAG: hypothetical protein KKD39_04895, partial [Candidatus Altiarchaeota archaeon]|nr:hypothetical protein [Candidatus Altiarchaeota archaeon]